MALRSLGLLPEVDREQFGRALSFRESSWGTGLSRLSSLGGRPWVEIFWSLIDLAGSLVGVVRRRIVQPAEQ